MKAALLEKSTELDCPIEAVVEMAGSFAVPKATRVSYMRKPSVLKIAY
ncbi:hypothetical protein ACKFKF_07795 [Phormidesmis sp. 146-12]